MTGGRLLPDRRDLRQRAAARAKVEPRSSGDVGRKLDLLEQTPDESWTPDLEKRRCALIDEYSRRFRAEQAEERERFASDDGGEGFP